MTYPVQVQTPEDMERDTFGTIARVADDIKRCAMNMDAGGTKVQFDFLRVTIGRLETIHKQVMKH